MGTRSRYKVEDGFQPDFSRFIRAITAKNPGTVPVGEIFADHETVGNFLGERVFDYSRMAADPNHRITARDLIDGYRYVDQTIRFCLATGWDYAYSFSAIPFPGFTYDLSENTSSEVKEDRQRYWVNDNRGPIGSWDDFERYPWPKKIRSINQSSRLMAKRIPDGMKVMVIPGGVFEWTTWLFGLTPFCFLLVDQPNLVDAVIQKVSNLIFAVVEEIYRRWSDRIGIIGGVDMHLLVSGTEELVRARTREILDICGPGGGYVLGTGNSVANYVPLKNYLAMLDEGRKWNQEHFPKH